MASSSSSTVSVKECDYLDQDPPLRGQNFVCLSFVSPEEVIKRKDVFMFEKFLKSFSEDMNEFFENLSLKYKDDTQMLNSIKERYQCVFNPELANEEYNFFVSKHSEELEKEYFEKNNFQTTIRGIKVRGTFESLKEAEIRAQVLRKMDSKFHVFVAEVGCWCPWSPNPDDISNQEYSETQLNTLMKGYKENQEKRDAFYQERKNDLIASGDVNALRSQEQQSENDLQKQEESLSNEDPWIKKVSETSSKQEE